MEVSIESLQRGLRDGSDASHLQRIRRDAQTCVTQLGVATACGDTECLKISLLGRVVRVNGKFHAICTFCGAVTRVSPERRFGIDICCLRCDPAMICRDNAELQRAENASALEDVPKTFRVEEAGKQSCRFCDKPFSANNANRFRLIRARSDRSTRNRSLPAPLRFVNYCGTHFRPWLLTAHDIEMDSRIIMAHISEKATPVMGAEAGSRAAALALVHADVQQIRPVKRKRTTKLEKRIAEIHRSGGA